MSLERTVDLLTELINMPTISADSNLDLIEYVGKVLQPLDADIELTYDEEANKANLFATLGPRIEGGIVLSGHTDVVPVEGQPWTVDPFDAITSRGRIYGRGACDMKGFIACVLGLWTHSTPSRVGDGSTVVVPAT